MSGRRLGSLPEPDQVPPSSALLWLGLLLLWGSSQHVGPWVAVIAVCVSGGADAVTGAGVGRAGEVTEGERQSAGKA